MASSILLATALPAANLLKNKFRGLLHPMPSLLSLTTTPSSFFHSSSRSKNNVAAPPAASTRMRVIPCLFDDEGDEEDEVDIDDRSYPSGSVTRFPRRDLSPHLLSDVMFMKNPMRNPVSRRGASGSRRREWDSEDDEEEEVVYKNRWDAKEDEEALYLKIEMPGLGKEDVKVSVEQNTLIIEAEEKIEEDEDKEKVLENQDGEKDGDNQGNEESEVDEDDERVRYIGNFEFPPNCFKLDQVKAEMKNGVLRVCVPKVKEEERKDIFQVEVQ